MRFLTFLLLALFLANNAAAAVRACLADPAVPNHAALHVRGAHAGDPTCPQSDESGPCLKHYVQRHQLDEQKTWASVPNTVLVPALDFPQFSTPATPKLVVLSSTPPVVAPPLTILYRNFRK